MIRDTLQLFTCPVRVGEKEWFELISLYFLIFLTLFILFIDLAFFRRGARLGRSE